MLLWTFDMDFMSFALGLNLVKAYIFFQSETKKFILKKKKRYKRKRRKQEKDERSFPLKQKLSKRENS